MIIKNNTNKLVYIPVEKLMAGCFSRYIRSNPPITKKRPVSLTVLTCNTCFLSTEAINRTAQSKYNEPTLAGGALVYISLGVGIKKIALDLDENLHYISYL